MTSAEKRQRHKEGHRSRVEAARIAQARADRRRRLVALGASLAFVAVVALAAMVLLGGDDDEETDASATTTTDPLATTEPDADGDGTVPVELPAPPEGGTLEGETPCPAEDGSEERVATFAQAPPTCIDEGQALEAVVTTSAGPLTIALDTGASPTMVNNFVVLARYRYFDGLPFHRLVPDFVAQGGSSGLPDYGSGGPGYTLPDEEIPDGYAPGDVAMARSPAGVSGSQFFIVASESGAGNLTNEYPLLGRVTEGIELVPELAAKGDGDAGGAPLELVTIESVEIRPAG